MSEEIMPSLPEADNQPDKMKGFKSVCMRLGLMMIVIFVSRGICSVILSLLSESLDAMETGGYLIETLISFAFLYAVPIVSAFFLL